MNKNTVKVVAFPQLKSTESLSAATSRQTFSERPHGTSVKVLTGVDAENTCTESLTAGSAFTLPNISLTELQKQFRHEYASFRAMRYERCGKRGKYVCHPNIATFPKFLAAFGPCPDPTYTLDRKDSTDLEYAAGKCEWASKQRQAENKTNTRYLEVSDGTRLPVSEWSRRSKVPSKTIHERIRRGWSVDEAVGTKVGGSRSPAKTSPPKESKSLFPDSAPADVARLLAVWERGVKQHHEHMSNCATDFLLEWRHIRMLEYIQEGLTLCRVPPENVVKLVLENWYDFVDDHCWSPGKPPYDPNLQFLKAHITDAACYYLEHGGERLPDYDDQLAQPVASGEFDGQL